MLTGSIDINTPILTTQNIIVFIGVSKSPEDFTDSLVKPKARPPVV